MKLFRSLLAVLTVCAWGGCVDASVTGSGNLATETRAVAGFHGVELASVGKLEIAQGDKEELVVEAEDNVLPLIETTVRPDGILSIAFKKGVSIRTTKPILFKLAVKTLDRIALAGSGEIHVLGKLTAESETLTLPGSGSITLDSLQTGTLSASIEGSGSIKAAGSASSQIVRVEGSGNYEASDLKTDGAKVSISGSGACKVWTEKTLEVSIGGSGEVAYYGHPVLKQTVGGTGDVRSLGAKGS